MFGYSFNHAFILSDAIALNDSFFLSFLLRFAVLPLFLFFSRQNIFIHLLQISETVNYSLIVWFCSVWYCFVFWLHWLECSFSPFPFCVYFLLAGRREYIKSCCNFTVFSLNQTGLGIFGREGVGVVHESYLLYLFWCFLDLFLGQFYIDIVLNILDDHLLLLWRFGNTFSYIYFSYTFIFIFCEIISVTKWFLPTIDRFFIFFILL